MLRQTLTARTPNPFSVSLTRLSQHESVSLARFSQFVVTDFGQVNRTWFRDSAFRSSFTDVTMTFRGQTVSSSIQHPAVTSVMPNDRSGQSDGPFFKVVPVLIVPTASPHDGASILTTSSIQIESMHSSKHSRSSSQLVQTSRLTNPMPHAPKELVRSGSTVNLLP
jgi:hypothetical protein